MNTLQAEKLREYIDVQIEYMLIKQEQHGSAPREEEIADQAWAAFLSALEERADERI